MTIREITTESEWNNFLLELKPNTFLQSWQWGQVQIKVSEKVWYLGIFDNNIQIGAALVIGVHARRGNYFLLPHGPILRDESKLKEVIEEIIKYTKQIPFSATALRISPLTLTTPESERVFKELGFHPAPLHIHAELTWVLDCSQSDEQILAGMRKTSRHAIRRAEKEGVIVEILSGPEGLNRFWPLYEKTTSRHGFVPFTRQFIESQVKEFGTNVYIPIASYKGQDVAGAIMFQFGNTVFYYHGASIKTEGNVPAPHLLHWHSMLEARHRGATRYNFWGIARDEEKNHPFSGITIFKKGFGGYALNYLHAQDLPLSLRYWPLWLLETIRKFRRGF